MRRHLDDQEFADYLMGVTSPETAAHVNECKLCRQEVDRAQGAVRNLRVASTQWSEAQPHIYLGQATSAPPRYMMRSMPRAAFAGVALALALAIPVALHTGSVLHRQDEAQELAKAAATQEAALRATERDQDQLLAAVSRELNEDVAPAMQPLMVAASTNGTKNTDGSQDQKKGDL